MGNEIWTYLKAEPLFKRHIPEIKNYKNKLRGKTSRGKVLGFTDREKMLIAHRVKKLLNNLLTDFKKEHDTK